MSIVKCQLLNVQSKSSGFTLVELLVVISIIGVLTAIGFVSFTNAADKGRDAHRKADLKAISGALVSYYQDHDAYPPDPAVNPGTQFTSDGSSPWIPGLTSNYLQNLPTDPKQTAAASPPEGCSTKNGVYCYIVSPNRSTFILWAQLDNTKDNEAIGNPGATCNIEPPPGNNPKYNYCLEAPK